MVGLIGVAVNTVSVIIGSLLGMIFKNGIPEKYNDIFMKGIGLVTIIIGISSALKGSNTIVLILSVILGALIGSLIDIDKHFNSLGTKIENKIAKNGNNKLGSFSTGFVTGCLVFCIGSMAIVGSLESGLNGDNTMIYTKSVLDFITSIILASSLGFGVCFSSLFVLVFQGLIVLLASAIAPFLNDTVINEMVSAGGIVILALGINLIKIGKFKVMNYLPAIFFPLALVPLYNLLNGLLTK